MKLLNVTALIGAGLMAAATTLAPSASLAQASITLSEEMLDLCYTYGAVSDAACACYLNQALPEGEFDIIAVEDALLAAEEDDDYYNLLVGCNEAN
ncbi:MAG: hypothetical protein AAGG51_08000 [Cyanobacteria bacterium P01_G01_bin.54]